MKGKTNEITCEDCYLISEHFVAVVDGVTSKSDFTYHEKTTGKLASEITHDAILELPKEATLSEALCHINQKMNQFYDKIHFPYDRTEKGLQAACVIYSNYHREIWMIGDCQVCVDGEPSYLPKKSDLILSEMRSLVLACLMEQGESQPNAEQLLQARELILPWILKVNRFANDDHASFGYPVLNGQSIPESLVKIIKLDGESHEIIFTSDGYPVMEPTLALTEQRLEEVLQKDPACYLLYPSTKGVLKGNQSFDDRTYLRFKI
ncbi:MAG: hypothetical protein R3Y07_03340 [Eubacteriales bacterium]